MAVRGCESYKKGVDFEILADCDCDLVVVVALVLNHWGGRIIGVSFFRL